MVFIDGFRILDVRVLNVVVVIGFILFNLFLYLSWIRNVLKFELVLIGREYNDFENFYLVIFF